MGFFDTIKISIFVKFLNAHGFYERNQTGSYINFHKHGCIKIITIPRHKKEIPVYVVKVAMKILKMSRDEFLKELKKY
jgi:predicted RNA binding protein YcfA (HicA-like mRNA interferase family)